MSAWVLRCPTPRPRKSEFQFTITLQSDFQFTSADAHTATDNAKRIQFTFSDVFSIYPSHLGAILCRYAKISFNLPITLQSDFQFTVEFALFGKLKSLCFGKLKLQSPNEVHILSIYSLVN